MSDITSSMGGIDRKLQVANAQDDVEILDALLKKLIDSKKITKKQLLQKLMHVNDKEDLSSNIE